MFELHAVPGLEHTDVEEGMYLAILLSRKRDAAFCPSLVAASLRLSKLKQMSISQMSPLLVRKNVYVKLVKHNGMCDSVVTCMEFKHYFKPS